VTDAEYREQKRRVEALVREWKPLLSLNEWQVDISHCRHGFRQSDGEASRGEVVIMTCSVMWEYLKATITVNTPELGDLDDDSLEEIVVHELCHIVVNEMREEENRPKHEERVVTLLGRSFRWLRGHIDGGWRERLEAAHEGVDD
jgi:hypothetical protein